MNSEHVKPKKKGGLAGVTAGQTAVATVGKEGRGLNYRGYSIFDLAENAVFEEVAFLLLDGHLPNQQELNTFTADLVARRELPVALKEALQKIPADAHPMDVLRTGCSMLGVLEPEKSIDDQHSAARRMLACFPSILTYWHRFTTENVEIDFQSDQESLAGFFLEKLLGEPPSELHRRAIYFSKIIYPYH